MTWWHRFVCWLDGHDWRSLQVQDFNGNRLYECHRCGQHWWRIGKEGRP